MKVRISKSNLIFNLAYIFYYISIFITYTAFGMAGLFKTLLAAATLLLLMFDFCFTDFKFKCSRESVIKISVIAVVFMISAVLRDYFLLVMIMFAINLINKPQKIKNIFKISYFILLISTILVLMLCVCGILPNKHTTRFEGSDEYRYALGFYHSNVLPNIILYLSIYYHVYKKNITLKSFAIFECFGTVVFLICDSKNAYLSMQIFMIGLFIYQHVRRKGCFKLFRFEKFLDKIGVLSYLGFCMLSLALMFLYKAENPVAVFMDGVLNSRLQMINLYLRYQQLKFVNFFTSDYFSKIILTLDNGYYYSIARYGLIYLIFLFYIMINACKKAKYEKNYYLTIGIIVLSLTNFIDNGFFSYSFYPFLLYSLSAVFCKNQDDLLTIKEYLLKNVR